MYKLYVAGKDNFNLFPIFKKSIQSRRTQFLLPHQSFMRTKLSLLVLFMAALMVCSCSSGKTIGGTNKNCGCGAKRGMVGY